MGVNKEVDTEVKKLDEVEENKTTRGGGEEVLKSRTWCFGKVSPSIYYFLTGSLAQEK